MKHRKKLPTRTVTVERPRARVLVLFLLLPAVFSGEKQVFAAGPQEKPKASPFKCTIHGVPVLSPLREIKKALEKTGEIPTLTNGILIPDEDKAYYSVAKFREKQTPKIIAFKDKTDATVVVSSKDGPVVHLSPEILKKPSNAHIPNDPYFVGGALTIEASNKTSGPTSTGKTELFREDLDDFDPSLSLPLPEGFQLEIPDDWETKMNPYPSDYFEPVPGHDFLKKVRDTIDSSGKLANLDSGGVSNVYTLTVVPRPEPLQWALMDDTERKNWVTRNASFVIKNPKDEAKPDLNRLQKQYMFHQKKLQYGREQIAALLIPNANIDGRFFAEVIRSDPRFMTSQGSVMPYIEGPQLIEVYEKYSEYMHSSREWKARLKKDFFDVHDISLENLPQEIAGIQEIHRRLHRLVVDWEDAQGGDVNLAGKPIIRTNVILIGAGQSPVLYSRRIGLDLNHGANWIWNKKTKKWAMIDP